MTEFCAFLFHVLSVHFGNVDIMHRTTVTLYRASYLLCRLSRFTVQSCHEFEVKLVKEKDRAKRKEVRSNTRCCL